MVSSHAVKCYRCCRHRRRAPAVTSRDDVTCACRRRLPIGRYPAYAGGRGLHATSSGRHGRRTIQVSCGTERRSAGTAVDTRVETVERRTWTDRCEILDAAVIGQKRAAPGPGSDRARLHWNRQYAATVVSRTAAAAQCHRDDDEVARYRRRSRRRRLVDVSTLQRVSTHRRRTTTVRRRRRAVDRCRSDDIISADVTSGDGESTRRRCSAVVRRRRRAAAAGDVISAAAAAAGDVTSGDDDVTAADSERLDRAFLAAAAADDDDSGSVAKWRAADASRMELERSRVAARGGVCVTTTRSADESHCIASPLRRRIPTARLTVRRQHTTSLFTATFH